MHLLRSLFSPPPPYFFISLSLARALSVFTCQLNVLKIFELFSLLWLLSKLKK